MTLHCLTGLQKLMFKGILKGEDKALDELGVKPNTRIMVVGSSLQEVMSLSAVPTAEEKKKLEEEPANTNPLSEQLVSSDTMTVVGCTINHGCSRTRKLSTKACLKVPRRATRVVMYVTVPTPHC